MESITDKPRPSQETARAQAMQLDPLRLRTPFLDESATTARETRGFGQDLAATIGWCVRVGRVAPRPGNGSTLELWELLAETAANDVAAARILEPHLDALAILEQAGTDLSRDVDPWHLAEVGVTPDSSWGVYAAEAPGSALRAVHHDAEWTLHGSKAWCSLAGQVSHALVTAFVGESERRLFAVDMHSAGVRPHAGPWHAKGLADVVSAPVDFDDVTAVPVGEAGWYLSRPGFAWGGMSVAAVWWGGAAGLMSALSTAASTDRADQLSLVHLGRADAALWGARAVLAEAAALVDESSAPDRRAATLLAERVRAVVVDAATLTLAEADAALGPAPLVADLPHARRVADLHLYLRQHHGPRDLARLGREVVAAGSAG